MEPGDIDDETRQEIAEEMERIAARIVREAKRRAPVGLSGQLRESITYEIVWRDDRPVARVGSPLVYAPHVEFGTGSRDTYPPKESIEDWVERVINPDESDQEGITWAIMKKIKREGTPKQPFLRPAVDHVEATYRG